MPDNKPTVEISNQQLLDFDEEPLIAVVHAILDDYGFARGEISIAVVDDQAMRELNRQYLDHDYETDVLSFVLDLDPDQGLLNGQLIVSADTAAREAAELGVPLQSELMLYVTHGTLHLVGFDDQDPASVLEMRSMEQEFLAAFDIVPRWDASEELD